MAVAGAALATVLVAAMVGLQPVLGRRRYRRLVEALPRDPDARGRHYRRGIIGEWTAVAVVVAIGALSGRGASSIGLPGRDVGAATGEVAGAAVVLAASAVLFRAESLRAVLRRQARGFVALLPRTGEERLLFVALAVTAGICEEVLFRGFGIAYVRWLWPDATHTWLIVVTSLAFGVAHLYQGPRGVALTAVIGAVFASLTLSTGSLIPAMVLHALVDLRILALPDLGSEAGPVPPPGGPV
ncbi:MAG TPA: CPBP family intramembrane glutamic endopeptidase [Acidimicrobiales bacterium]